MNRSTIVVLKVLIALLLALLLFCQIAVVPPAAAILVWRYPEFAPLHVLGVFVGVTFTLCGQIVLVCVWRLLSLVRADGIFSVRAFAWVDAALWAVVAATLLVGVSLVALEATTTSHRSLALLGLIGIVVGSGMSLLTVVLRGLLRKAAQLEHDLSEVV
jgi:xanthosine utilization system XapX-like protein